MAAPAVQNLSDIVSQIGAAYAPQKALIDQSIAANDASGAAQQAGLQAKQTQAFSNIDQTATNRGMAFSGFTPDAEAKYTGSTYLPALANLQNTIAATRNNLMGKRAGLDTAANTQAFTVHQGQVNEAQKWQDTQDAAARAEQIRQEQNAFTANQNALNRSAAASRAATSAAATKAAAVAQFNNDVANGNQALKGMAGSDGYISPAAYNNAKQQWQQAGYTGVQFDHAFSGFRNPNQSTLHPADVYGLG